MCLRIKYFFETKYFDVILFLYNTCSMCIIYIIYLLHQYIELKISKNHEYMKRQKKNK